MRDSFTAKPAIDDRHQACSARFEWRQPSAAFASNALRDRADVERGDRRAGEPRFGKRETERLRNDRRQNDESDAMTRQQRRQLAAAVIAVNDDVRNAPQRAQQIDIAAAENVQSDSALPE